MPTQEPSDNLQPPCPPAAPPQQPPRTRIIVGLGNPGSRYSGTRHNIGFVCIDSLAKRWNVPLSDRRQHVALGQGELEGNKVVLAKPRTYMNNSGEAVRYLLDRFHCQPSDLVIIYDEMDLPLGAIRLRPRGGTAGHQGMASIVNLLGTSEFPRVRVGVGKPGSSDDWVRYVLEPFTTEELLQANEVVERVVDSLAFLLLEGIERAMNRFNPLPSPQPADPPADITQPTLPPNQRHDTLPSCDR